MEETILNAIERTMPPKLCRKAGFTPGVLYGDNVSTAITVKFETAVLKKIIATHGANAKVWVQYNGDKNFGYIKEVQRDPVTAKLIHTDVFLVSLDREVSMQIPITYEGRDNLDNVLLQVHKTEVEISGKVALMPESVVVDVSTMVLGDTITSNNFNLDKQLTVTEDENEVYGVITLLPELVVEEPETVAEGETEAGAEAETKK